MIARWLVSGQVQGVGFRAFVARRATELGLAGQVRNLPDGRVEVVAEGSDHAVSSLRQLVSIGPRMAKVSAVDNAEILVDMTGYKSFTVK